jgi:hypothetical protein
MLHIARTLTHAGYVNDAHGSIRTTGSVFGVIVVFGIVAAVIVRPLRY